MKILVKIVNDFQQKAKIFILDALLGSECASEKLTIVDENSVCNRYQNIH